MQIVQPKCPNCGSNLVLGNSANVICGHCGASLIVETSSGNTNTYNNSSHVLEKPTSVTDYGKDGFEIENGVLVKYWGVKANVIIPETVKKIGNSAFEDVFGLEIVSLPNSLEEIGDRAFYRCHRLGYVDMQSSLKKIGEYAFYGCSNLNNVYLPEKLQFIGKYAFSCCKSIKEISIPEGIKTLSEGVFEECSSLAVLNLPDSLTEIERCALSGWVTLEVTNNMTRIEDLRLSDYIVVPDGYKVETTNKHGSYIAMSDETIFKSYDSSCKIVSITSAFLNHRSRTIEISKKSMEDAMKSKLPAFLDKLVEGMPQKSITINIFSHKRDFWGDIKQTQLPSDKTDEQYWILHAERGFHNAIYPTVIMDSEKRVYYRSSTAATKIGASLPYDDDPNRFPFSIIGTRYAYSFLYPKIGLGRTSIFLNSVREHKPYTEPCILMSSDESVSSDDDTDKSFASKSDTREWRISTLKKKYICNKAAFLIQECDYQYTVKVFSRNPDDVSEADVPYLIAEAFYDDLIQERRKTVEENYKNVDIVFEKHTWVNC